LGLVTYTYFMINRCFLTILCLVLVFGLFSCDDGDKTVGAIFMNPSGSLAELDTFSVSISTFQLDTITTSNQGVALVGSIEDNIFGKISSRSYVMFGLASVSQVSEDAEIDSLVLSIGMSGYYYGDTLQELEFGVHRITERVEYPYSKYSLYQNSSFAFDSKPIGEFSRIPRPKSKDVISTHLSLDLGDELLEILKSDQSSSTAEEDFVESFKGIVFEPYMGKSIVGFGVNDTSMILKLYYHIPTEVENESQQVNFYPYETDRRFTQIVSIWEGTLTEHVGLSPISSEETGGNSFIQGGTGIVTRLDFPSLNELMKLRKNVQVVKAELIVTPEYSDASTLPASLNLYYTNKFNDFLQEFTTTDDTALDGNLNIDDVDPSNTTYSWDITSYVLNVLGKNTSNLNGLLIVPENYTTGFDHVAIANQLKSKFKTRLKIYTITYE